jgi:hypothetical protein
MGDAGEPMYSARARAWVEFYTCGLGCGLTIDQAKAEADFFLSAWGRAKENEKEEHVTD